MNRSKTLLAALALPLFVACTSPETTEEPVNVQVEADAQELDPNDPNVEQCPVTGALQLKSDADGSTHGQMDGLGSVSADHD